MAESSNKSLPKMNVKRLSIGSPHNLNDSAFFDDTEKSDTIHAFFNFFKALIGVGIMALPYALQQAGYILSTIYLCVLTFFVLHQILIINKIVEDRHLDEITYP